MTIKITPSMAGAFIGCLVGHYVIGGTLAIMVCSGLGSLVSDWLVPKS